MCPPRPRHARRARSELAPVRPIAAATPRPVQSILPRRLIDSPSASHPAGGFAFPPPADYVPPSPPREEARPPIRPIGVVKPAAPIEETPSPPPVVRIVTPPAEPIAPPAAPPEPEPVVAYIPPPAVEVEPQSSEPQSSEPQSSEPQPAPIEAEPPTEPPTIEPEPQPATSTSAIPAPELWPAELRALEPEPPPLEPEASPLEPETFASPPPVEPTSPAEPPALLRRRRSKISPHARPHRVLRPAPLEEPSAV